MPLFDKLTARLTGDGGEGDRDTNRCQCLNCGSTFRSPKRPAAATCPACDSNRIRKAESG